MSYTLRQEKILELLGVKESISVSELAELFQVTTMTVRRDLDVLAQKGIVSRSYGYAMLVKNELSLQPSFQERERQNRDCKRRIAQKAVELISPKATPRNGNAPPLRAGQRHPKALRPCG